MVKVAVVTGAGRGAGKGIAKVLARNGVTVVLVSRNKDDLEKVLKEIQEEGGQGLVAPTDTGDRESVKNLATLVIDKFGAPDILVNNAASFYFQDFLEIDYESWDNMIDVNIRGYLSVIGEFLPAMKAAQKGHIVNITSDSERFPFASVTVYTGTKFFWGGTTPALRMELKGSGVKISNVQPGFIWTEGLARCLRDEKMRAAMIKHNLADPDVLLESKDLMLQPEDVGQAVWEVVNKPPNVYIQEVLLRDMYQ